MKINEKDIDNLGEFAKALARGINETGADSVSVNIELSHKYITLSLRVIDCSDIESCEVADEENQE